MGVSAIDISASGMRAQRLRMETIANNLANVDNTNAFEEYVTVEDQTYVRHHPYRRREVIFTPGGLNGREPWGVSTPMVIDDPSAGRIEHDPTHPHAVGVPGQDYGKVFFPNVNPIVEMVDMIAASRAYEANITAVETWKSMGQATLRILA